MLMANIMIRVIILVMVITMAVYYNPPPSYHMNSYHLHYYCHYCWHYQCQFNTKTLTSTLNSANFNQSYVQYSTSGQFWFVKTGRFTPQILSAFKIKEAWYRQRMALCFLFIYWIPNPKANVRYYEFMR